MAKLDITLAFVITFLIYEFGRFGGVALKAELTKINCTSYDEEYASVAKCELRAINRAGLKEMSFHIRPHRFPVDNITLTVLLMKKSNGYKPYHREVFIDVCKYFESRSNPLMAYFLSLMGNRNNLNHTCPYNHDFILDRMRVNISTILYAPMPTGEYAFFSTWWTNRIKRLYMEVYFKFEE